MSESASEPKPGGRFRTTRWSLVRQAGRSDEVGRRALSDLCHTYWYPLYAFLRRRGSDPDEAADLTQGFFARLLEKGDLAKVEAGRGRFRSFLLTSLQNFSSNEWAKQQAEIRGGGV